MNNPLTDNLFVTDMDGTLLGADSRVSRRSAAIISELSRRGAQITVATARTPATVEPLLANTVINPPAVVLIGAGMWDHRLKEFITMRYLDPDVARGVVELVMRFGLHPIVYRLEPDRRHLTFHFDKVNMPSDEYRFVSDRLGLELKRPVITDDPAAAADNPSTILVLALGERSHVLDAVAALRGNEDVSVGYYDDGVYPGVTFLEVFGPDVNKAEGVRRLKRMTGARHVTVFGDSYNDLPMMNVADTAVAVANGVDDVKKAADIVIGANTEDAVPRYIARTLGIDISGLL